MPEKKMLDFDQPAPTRRLRPKLGGVVRLDALLADSQFTADTNAAPGAAVTWCAGPDR